MSMLDYIFPLILTLLGLWVVVSIPVWISAKIFTSGRVGFGQAMGATLLGPLAYIIVFSILNVIQTLIINNVLFSMISFIIAILSWLGTFKIIFKTGWLKTIVIVIVAIIIFIVGSIAASMLLLTLIPEMPSNVLPVPRMYV